VKYKLYEQFTIPIKFYELPLLVPFKVSVGYQFYICIKTNYHSLVTCSPAYSCIGSLFSDVRWFDSNSTVYVRDYLDQRIHTMNEERRIDL
jgi:hypothetical protein